MSSNTLKKITTRAKQIRKKHPAMQWRTAVKKAGCEYRTGKIGSAKPKSKNRQTGSSNKFYDRNRSARPPGPRIPAGGTKITYTERRKNRSDVPGTLEGISISKIKSELKSRLKKKLDNTVIQKYHAKGKRIKKQLQKSITAIKSEMRKINS